MDYKMTHATITTTTQGKNKYLYDRQLKKTVPNAAKNYLQLWFDAIFEISKEFNHSLWNLMGSR
jgi:hypothetical protein